MMLINPRPEKISLGSNQVAVSFLVPRDDYLPGTAALKLTEHQNGSWGGRILSLSARLSQIWCDLILCVSVLPGGAHCLIWKVPERTELPSKLPFIRTLGTSLLTQSCLLLHHGRFFGFQDMVC